MDENERRKAHRKSQQMNNSIERQISPLKVHVA
jgi:hypothetical protein